MTEPKAATSSRPTLPNTVSRANRTRIPNASDRADMVRVRDEAGNILPNRVPRTWLKRFPQLKEIPSTRKAGK